MKPLSSKISETKDQKINQLEQEVKTLNEKLAKSIFETEAGFKFITKLKDQLELKQEKYLVSLTMNPRI